MQWIRWCVGKLLLALNALFRPKGVVRSVDDQAKLDAVTAHMALYQFEACPFCIKVRRAMARLGLQIELRDARNDKTHGETLVKEGGKRLVPCLRISQPEGPDQWMYESTQIVQHLEALVAAM
jgi:glutaredoxin